MRKLIFIVLTFTLLSTLFAQEMSLKEKAIDEFKKEHYDRAIKILEKALKENKNDAEIYYYLGYFNHYRAYDSRPLKGYDFSYSKRILKYLDKAIELKPNYGDAKYFYGAECSANSFVAMQSHNLDKLKYFYELAYKKGAFPDWLIEFGKNLLNSCSSNAILITGGDADFDVCAYLQLLQNYRTDITVIPIGNINRPWFIKFLKQGLKGGIKKINLNLSDNQIYDIHPFKWKTTETEIPVSELKLNEYKLEKNYKMIWTIEPDLISNPIHSKNEKVKDRTYLSPRKAILLQIVEDNFQYRPIFFSNMTNPIFLGGLDDYFKNCGLVSELIPIKTERTEYENDYQKMNKLLKDKNFKLLSSIKTSDIPRISRNILSAYYSSVWLLATHYFSIGEVNKLNELKKFFKKYLKVGYNKKYEEMLLNRIDTMTKRRR